MQRTAIAMLIAAALIVPGLVIAAPKDIDRVNGAIRTEAGVEYGDLETVNGSIRLASGASARSVETVNGSIVIEDQGRAGSAETVNGSITARNGASIQDNLSTVNGAISLAESSVAGGRVETVNGGIRLDFARVDGNIETVNGDIEVLAGSIVKGGIFVRKPSGSWFNFNNNSRVPRVVIGANSVVEGELVFEREVELLVDPSAKIGKVTGATAKTMEVERRAN
jgi:DUF4097 and DUF4098 domain-containing protein YvlB